MYKPDLFGLILLLSARLVLEISLDVSTRNLRLAAIHSFFKYVQYQNPENIYEYQKIMSIGNKKAPKPAMNYLTVEGIRLLLQQPDTAKARGRRNLALLSLMYDTGARVSEIINITPQCIRLNVPYTIIITGKGNKTRVVPVLEEQLTILRTYMTENGLLLPENMQHPLFSKLKREAIEKAYSKVAPDTKVKPVWQGKGKLMDFLKSF